MSAKKAEKKLIKTEEEIANTLKGTWREICQRQKGLMIAMIVVLVMSAILLLFSLSALRPQSTVVITGYGDVYGEIVGISGGYRRGSWANIFAFSILAFVYGVLHNLLILRIYRKYGRDAAMVVAIVTMILIVATVVVLVRLMREW